MIRFWILDFGFCIEEDFRVLIWIDGGLALPLQNPKSKDESGAKND